MADIHIFYDLPIRLIPICLIIPDLNLKIVTIGLDYVVDLIEVGDKE